MMQQRRSLVACCIALLVAHSAALLVTIRNDVPRLDDRGRIVNAHDGSVELFDGMFYMY